MKRLIPLALLGFVAASRISTPVASTPVVADYVEARSASVFCGACHYNGERVTAGREAVFGIRISSGSWRGVDLTGVTAVGEVSCDDNLAETSAARRTTIVVDRSASEAQAAATVDYLRVKSGDTFGTVTAGARSTITFKHDVDGYRVDAPGFADLTVHPMPDNACCTQPHLVWYQPMVTLEHRKVGFTDVADYTAVSGDAWQRTDENSAFYGTVADSGK
jgi:hypothetical protein